ncbi:Sugar kinase of the NBD/HSP70 family, may contain an N-terminal HTH domain [Ruaniaceae bacterium KH17]|nr:Sugar kinase of the NBD/HSP70 family, may contain an N-terminal HTH domain [Ruaniaceae bacterium KH17]
MVRSTGADASSVRQWNEQRVLDVLRGGESLRVSELALETGLTTVALRDVLRTLAAKGWIEEREATQGGKGRPAQTYQMRPIDDAVLGLDIGGHAVRAVLTREGAETRHEVPIVPADDMIAATREAVAAVLAEFDTSNVWVTGVALSGIIDRDGRVVRSVALGAFEGERPCELLADLIPGRAHPWHDTRASLWAEHERGTATEHTNVLYLHLGRRPNMALLLKGRLHEGTHGSAGELTLNELIPHSFDWSSDGADAQGDSLRAALGGDPGAVAGARGLLLGLAAPIAFVTALIDPSLLVIGGSLAPVVAPVVGEFRNELEARLETAPRVATSALDQFAAAQGARSLSLKAMWSELTDDAVLPRSADSLA